MSKIRANCTHKWEAADVQQMELKKDEQSQHPKDVHHSIQNVSILMVDTVHVDVDEFHLQLHVILTHH